MITKVTLNVSPEDWCTLLNLKITTDTGESEEIDICYEGDDVEEISYRDVWRFAGLLASGSGIKCTGELQTFLTKSECAKMQQKVDSWNELYKTDIKINNDKIEED